MIWLTTSFVLHSDCRDKIPETRKIRIERYKHNTILRRGYEPFDHHCALLEQQNRILECILSLTLAARCLFFFQLIDFFAPIINTIWILFFEIRYFLGIMFIYYVAFAMGYYLIGRN